MNVIVAGPDDHDIATAIESAGHTVQQTPHGNRPALEEAGIHDAAVLVLTEVELATAVPVAKDLHDDVRVVLYCEGSLPDFASRQADMLVDPALLDPEAVAAEL
jgi:hypothetical protein